MASSNNANDLRRANFRLCRLCSWTNYDGLGFNLDNTTPPPHIIRSVDSNSPAAAGGLRILDVLLAVNNQDVSAADYRTTTQAIRDVRANNNRLELLVIEQRFYTSFKTKGIVFDPIYARIVDSPTTMPRDFEDFPKNLPRTCEIQLRKNDQSFGFEVANGPQNIGMSIQDIIPNTPAALTALRRCDRILEIDGKFIDNETSSTIIERLTKAKKKRTVTLYVVDTHTYKYFREKRIPLPSKEFQKSNFARQYQPEKSSYINVADVNNPPRRTDINIPQPTLPSSGNYQSNIHSDANSFDASEDDIRLCSINRLNATDSYGIELNFHRREQYHTLRLAPSTSNTPTNAALAGVKSGDHLIEINGENVEDIGDDQVKERIRAIQYPQPLQLLVVDEATYRRYKQQNKVIHSGLPNVRKLPTNINERPVSFRRSHQNANSTTTVSPPVVKPSATIEALVGDVFYEGEGSLESSLTNRQQFVLHRIPGVSTYGFSVITTHIGTITHRITEILPNSPAAQQGLRVGDNILSVNNQDVTQMDTTQFTQFLRTSARNAEAHSQPLVIEVVHDDSYQPSLTSNVPPRRPTEQSPSNIPDPTIISSKPPQLISSERRPSKNPSQTSTSIQPTIYQEGIQRLTETPLTEPSSTRPIVSRNGSQKSTPNIQSIPYQNGTSSYLPNQMPPTRSYTNGYDTSRYSRQDIRAYETTSQSSLYRSRENLTRGAIDLVAKSRLLRYCQLYSGPSQAFGFQLRAEDDKHIVHNIQLDSPAMQAGLHENDRLLEVDGENVEGKSTRDVAILIRNAAYNGKLRVLVAPSDVKVLSRRTARSLTALNDMNHSLNSTIRSKYDDQYSSSSIDRYQSNSRRHDEQNYQHRSSVTRSSNYRLSEPSEPLPRRCVLQRDLNFRGCGFQLTQKHNCDTPIVVDIAPDSPAQRSGLTEGDHIIYIDSQNVQNFNSFDDIIHLIQQSFNENGQITLISLTDLAYQVLRRRGGYLESAAFDYQARNINQLKPRLCQLKLYNHQYDFGFTLQQHDPATIKDIQSDSAAETYGLRKNDIILEVNGRTTNYLSIEQIKQIIKTSQEERKLDLLVIDPDGYRFSIRHGIPLNSHLSFVERGDERMTTTNERYSHSPVYL